MSSEAQTSYHGIAARLDRIPITGMHRKVLWLLAGITFCDSVDMGVGGPIGAVLQSTYDAAGNQWMTLEQFKRGLHHFPHYRHHRVFHHTDRIKLDCAGRRRCRQLPQECEPKGIPGRFPGGWYGRSSGGKHCRKAYQIITV